MPLSVGASSTYRTSLSQPNSQYMAAKVHPGHFKGTGSTMTGQQLTEQDFLQPMGIHIPCQLSDSFRGLVNGDCRVKLGQKQACQLIRMNWLFASVSRFTIFIPGCTSAQ